MSGKRMGGAFRPKGGNAKSNVKPNFVPKAVLSTSTNAPTTKSKPGNPKKGESVATTEPEAQEVAIPRQGRLRPAPALLALTASRSLPDTKKTASSPESNTTNNPTKAASAATLASTSTTPVVASSTANASETAAAAPPKRSATRPIPPAPRRTTPTAEKDKNNNLGSESSESTVNPTETTSSMDVDEPTPVATQNPKKRKAPDQLEMNEVTKKTFSAPAPSAAWMYPISTIDPNTMTLQELDSEIDGVKKAISTVKDAIRAALAVK